MIRVVLVSDQEVLRHGLRMRLGLEPDIHVVSEAETAEAAVAMATDLQPDVVVLDIDCPEVDAFAMTALLRKSAPSSAVVILTMLDDRMTRRRAQALSAITVVGKHEPSDTLMAAIRRPAHRES
jgi:DNA-binding NarL/FixJ family response regulator